MLQSEQLNKLTALSGNAEFMENLAACEGADEMVVLFHAEGIEISTAELNNILASVTAQTDNEELSEEALDDVSGGALWVPIVSTIIKMLLQKNRSSGGGGKGSFGDGGGGGGGR